MREENGKVATEEREIEKRIEINETESAKWKINWEIVNPFFIVKNIRVYQNWVSIISKIILFRTV